MRINDMWQPIKPTDLVYISGPMTGLPDSNRAAFMKAERYLRTTYGCGVLNPACMPDGLTYRQYIAHAMQLLTHATVIALLPGYDESLGAALEFLVADRDGVPVVKLVETEKKEQKQDGK